MTAKEYLRRGLRTSELIQAHQEKLAMVKDQLNSLPSINFSKTGSSNNWNGQTQQIKLMEECIDFERQIEKEINNLLKIEKEISAAIDTLTDGNERLALYSRYVLNESTKETMKRMHYSETNVKRIIGQALKHIEINMD